VIREDQKLPDNVLDNMPEIIQKMKKDKDVVAFYTFGSLAQSNLKPLSDLDFAFLLSGTLNGKERFDKHLDLIGTFTAVFHTEEIDLIILNDAPPRFSYNILKEGECLFTKDKGQLIDFLEYTNKMYIEFKRVRDEFDSLFLEGIGYNG